MLSNYATNVVRMAQQLAAIVPGHNPWLGVLLYQTWCSRWGGGAVSCPVGEPLLPSQALLWTALVSDCLNIDFSIGRLDVLLNLATGDTWIILGKHPGFNHPLSLASSCCRKTTISPSIICKHVQKKRRTLSHVPPSGWTAWIEH